MRSQTVLEQPVLEQPVLEQPVFKRTVMKLSVAVWATLLLAGCGESTDRPAGQAERFTPSPLKGVAFADTSAEFPHLLYTDGAQTLNDRCPVRRSKLNRRMPPVYVNHRPIGFC